MTYESGGLAPVLEQFVAVARHEHISRAAEALGLPQPTVSRSMARLAEQLGVTLLVRQGRGVVLTRQGRLLAEHARRALADLHAGVDAVRLDADVERGTVVLGFLHSMGPAAVPSLLAGFRRDHAEVTVRLVQSSAEVVAGGVVAGEVDLAVVSPVPTHAALRHRVLARQALVVAVPERHRYAARRRLRIEDLVGEDLVTMRPGYGVRSLTDALLRTAGSTPSYAFESEELTTVAGLVAAGLGVAVLPRGSTAGAPPGAVEIALSTPGAHRDIALVWAGDRRLTPPVQALRRHLLDHAGAALA